jgi:5-methylcytosine-specific restriction endonuclease McrA
MRDSAYNSTRKRARARATIAASPRCEDCGATTNLTADHLIPVIDGGATGPLRTLCRSCNSRRGSKTLAG